MLCCVRVLSGMCELCANEAWTRAATWSRESHLLSCVIASLVNGSETAAKMASPHVVHIDVSSLTFLVTPFSHVGLSCAGWACESAGRCLCALAHSPMVMRVGE